MAKGLKAEIGDALQKAFPDAKVEKQGGTTVITVNADKLEKGHNKMANATDERLRLLVERIERLEEEKKGISDDIRDAYAEAKAVGYDPAIMRKVIRLRKMKPDDLNEKALVLETYCNALGVQGVLF
jgi:uncharacterized protein (UPF0335 family)